MQKMFTDIMYKPINLSKLDFKYVDDKYLYVNGEL